MPDTSDPPLQSLLLSLSECRHCEIEQLIPAARPVFQAAAASCIGLFSQAPGNLAHQSGKPFLDPSGERLRTWLNVSEKVFYDARWFSILPMAFCFPGYDGRSASGKGGDLPPPAICAQLWRQRLMQAVWPGLKLILLIGQHSQRWHVPSMQRLSLPERVALGAFPVPPPVGVTGEPVTGFCLPHPSWRNTGWLKKHPQFERDSLPQIRRRLVELGVPQVQD